MSHRPDEDPERRASIKLTVVALVFAAVMLAGWMAWPLW
jgi:hypothetical protein